MAIPVKLSHLLFAVLLSAAGFYPVYLLVSFVLDQFLGAQALSQAFLYESKRELIGRIAANWVQALPAGTAIGLVVVLPASHYANTGRSGKSLLYLVTSGIVLALSLFTIGMSTWQLLIAVTALLLLYISVRLAIRCLPRLHA